MSSTAAAEVRIKMPVDQVWERMRDLSLAPRYVPGLTGCRFNTEQKEGVGASRRVFQQRGPAMDETVVEWNEGRGFTIRLHKGAGAPPMFKEAVFVYSIEDAGNGETLFKPAMVYTMPWGGVGSMLDKLLLNRVIRGIVLKVGLGLKRFYETGVPSNPAYRG